MSRAMPSVEFLADPELLDWWTSVIRPDAVAAIAAAAAPAPAPAAAAAAPAPAPALAVDDGMLSESSQSSQLSEDDCIIVPETPHSPPDADADSH